MVYINRKQGTDTQTIAQFSTRQEAITVLPRFKRKDTGAYVYVSTRCTSEWKRAHSCTH